MNIKKFRLVSKTTSFILKSFAFLGLISLAFGIFFSLSRQPNITYEFDLSSRSLFSSQSGQILEADKRLATLILAAPFTLALCYAFWQGATIFDRLTDGEIPFSHDFANSVKKVSMLLITVDIAIPILYSLVLSLIMENGHYVVFGFTSLFFIGLILYIVSEILSYGIELQKLADDTV